MNKKKEITFLYVKNNQINQTSITAQTRRIRNKTNIKIRDLGNKYLVIKSLFEQLSIKRDTLYLFGKKLEEEYKETKKGIHLQNQIKRMKEALYCWYAEYFFTELCQFNSSLLKRLTLFTNSSKVLNSLSKLQLKMIKRINRNINNMKEQENEDNLQNTTDNAVFNEIITNQEIDNFEFSNINMENTNEKNSTSSSNNNMFDFEKLLNF